MSRKRELFPLAEDYWAKVAKTEYCWNWLGSLFDGYGRYSHKHLAHRASYEDTYGPIPEGQQVLHHCDNRACVRPSHLFLGDNTLNVIDRNNKGRNAKGEKHGAVKLTTEQVLIVRDRWSNRKVVPVAQAEIAQELGVTVGTISNIITRYTWKHLA